MDDGLTTRTATVYLADIVSVGDTNSAVCSEDKSSIKPSYSPSLDDLFVSKLIKTYTASDLNHFLYSVSQDPSMHYDFALKVFLFYQPDNWPFANRVIQMKAIVYKADGAALFCVDENTRNIFGSLGDYVGYSGEEMLSGIAHETTAHILVRLDNTP